MATEKDTSGLLSGAVGMPFALVGGLGNTFAQIAAGKQAKKGEGAYRSAIEGLLAGQRADIEGLLGGDAYRNYLETAQAQSVMEAARQQLQDHATQIRGGVARSGGTAEASVAAQTAGTRGYADIVNRLAGHGTQYNQTARARLMSARQGLGRDQGQYATNLYSMSQNKAAGISQAGQNFSNSMVGLGESYSSDIEGIMKLLGL
jgi:hypothetical protein